MSWFEDVSQRYREEREALRRYQDADNDVRLAKLRYRLHNSDYRKGLCDAALGRRDDLEAELERRREWLKKATINPLLQWEESKPLGRQDQSLMWFLKVAHGAAAVNIRVREDKVDIYVGKGRRYGHLALTPDRRVIYLRQRGGRRGPQNNRKLVGEGGVDRLYACPHRRANEIILQ